MRTLDRDELVDVLSYALLKVPPLTREALAAQEPAHQRSAEAVVADRIARELDQVQAQVLAPAGLLVARSDPRQAVLPLAGA